MFFCMYVHMCDAIVVAFISSYSTKKSISCKYNNPKNNSVIENSVFLKVSS